MAHQKSLSKKKEAAGQIEREGKTRIASFDADSVSGGKFKMTRRVCNTSTLVTVETKREVAHERKKEKNWRNVNSFIYTEGGKERRTPLECLFIGGKI